MVSFLVVHMRSMNVADAVEQSRHGGPSDTLYIMYTSGSTSAVPKGVRGSYSALLNRIGWQWETFPFHSTNEIACKRT